MSSPSSNSKRSPSPTPGRKSLRSRMGTIARRSSSFLLPSRSASPAARQDSEDPMAAAAGGKGVSSKPSSIRSVERPPPVPLVMPEEKPEEPKPEPAPMEAPATTVESAPETVPELPAAEPVSQPVAEPVAEPAPASGARPAEEQKPAEESYAPVYVSESTTEPREAEHHEEPGPEAEPQHEEQHQGISIPFSESPRSLSASLPSEDYGYQVLASAPALTHSGESTPKSSSEEMNHPRMLSVNTSQENLVHELSPIQEDERSALEEKRMPFAQPNGLPPSSLSAPPIVGPTLSETSAGTTPRAMPVPLIVKNESQMAFVEDKGKAKDVNGSAVAPTENLPQEGYFSRSAPMPVPHVAEEHYDLEDPFKDPSPSTTHYDSMPEPETHSYNVSEHHVSVEPVHPAAPTMSMPAAYPLPPLNEVTSGNLRSMPSDYTLGARSSREPSVHHEVQTDETLPLLSGPKGVATDGIRNRGDIPYRDFQSAGWIAHSLPDSTTYYTHPGMRITTDIDLQRPRKLAAAMSYLEGKLAKEVALPVDGIEIWLHDEARSREEFVPVRCWVNHEARALGYWPPPSHRQDVAAREYADDKLDYEYRYWAFMETHPVHVPLPVNAYAEALDKVTWSYTERLLKSNRRAPPPFTQHESQELLNILRSTSGSESSTQAAIQTRVVSRVHRRIVQWKQHFFRPDKPLPRGMSSLSHSQRNMPNRQTFVDFALAWMCLGIPYLYANRHVYRFDEEGGIMRSAGPMVVVGAAICIVAATILLASITFLALPGLDHISRTAGFIAIIGSFASLGASLIAAARNQVEIQQRAAAQGGEGLVVIMYNLTGNSILPSLPAVFLAWSIISLVTGVVLYAFRGSVSIDSNWTRFASFTRWTTIGVLGFCGGALLVSMFAIRR